MSAVVEAASPLALVERAVQTRAKELVLDVGRVVDRERLRDLVSEEVALWNDHHRRGTRPFAIDDPALLVDRAMRNLTGYGPLEPLLG